MSLSGEVIDKLLHEQFADGIIDTITWYEPSGASGNQSVTGNNGSKKDVSICLHWPIPSISNVIFSAPATVVLWDDGSKTVVKCQGRDVYNKETGLAMCIVKKAFGNNGNFNEIFKKWIPGYAKDDKSRAMSGNSQKDNDGTKRRMSKEEAMKMVEEIRVNIPP